MCDIEADSRLSREFIPYNYIRDTQWLEKASERSHSDVAAAFELAPCGSQLSPDSANLFRENIVIHFSARVGVPEVIALSSCVLGFSRPRVRDVTYPRKQVAIQAGD